MNNNNEQKDYKIEWSKVLEAFQKVKANNGCPGADGISIADIEKNPSEFLMPLWNKMLNGSYFPDYIRQVTIPKPNGSKRILEIPTVTDRVAQQVIKYELEQIANSQFSPNSFGYRPNTSTYMAVEQCRTNCNRYRWIIKIDIKNFFQSIDHKLLMSFVRQFIEKEHILIYLERWIQIPVQLKNGSLKFNKGKGTPQGGVISPLLSNIFLHFTFDVWFEKVFPENSFERYADDLIIHCQEINEAKHILKEVKKRLKEYKLEINKKKSKILFCPNNHEQYQQFKSKYKEFEFLGFRFKSEMITEVDKTEMTFITVSNQKSKTKKKTLNKNKQRSKLYPLLKMLRKTIKTKIYYKLIHFYHSILWRLRNLFYMFRWMLRGCIRNFYHW